MAITKADLLNPDPFSSARRTQRQSVARARRRITQISHPPAPPAASGIAAPAPRPQAPTPRPAAHRGTPRQRVRRRSTAAPTITRADLLASDPFSAVRRQQAARLRQAVAALPNPTPPRTHLASGPTFSAEGPGLYRRAFAHNQQFAIAGPYQTQLAAPQEHAFRAWVRARRVPFDPNAHVVDYDMRGFYKATGGRWRGGHFPDTFKTPFDTTFSAESRYAKAGTPFVWRGNELVDKRDGTIVFGPGKHEEEAFRRALLASPLGQLHAADRAASDRASRAVGRLPNPPRLLQVPAKTRYSQRERALILREQGRRLVALSRETGRHGADLLAVLPPEDRRQLALFAQLSRQRQDLITRRTQAKVARRLLAEGLTRRQVARILASPASARPGRKGDYPSPLQAGIGAVLDPRHNLFAAVAPAVGQLAAPMARDARDLVIHTPDSLYQLGRAGVGLAKYAGTAYPGAHGHDSADLEPAQRVAEGFTQGFIGNVVRGRFRDAAMYAGEHPLFTALEVSGAQSALGRGAGAVMRSGALGTAARDAASMARPSLVDPYGRVMATRRYPADVMRKAAIVAYERHLRARGGDPGIVRPSHVPYRGLHQASAGNVDEFAAAAEGMRRMGRDTALRRLHGALPERGGNRVARALDRRLPAHAPRTLERIRADRLARRFTRPEQDVLHAVVEGRVNPARFADDLRLERDRLNRAYAHGTDPRRTGWFADEQPMSTSARVANRQQVRAIERVLRNPRALANAEGVARAATRYKAIANRVEQEAVRRGLLDPEQALAAKVRPYAVARMGARYDRRLTPPEHMAERYDLAQRIERDAATNVARRRVEQTRSAQNVRAAERELAVARGRAQGTRAASGSTTVLQRQRTHVEAARLQLARARVELADAARSRRGAEERLRMARRSREAANPKRYVTGLVGRDGRRLSTEAVIEHMRANGVDLPAFVSHRMDTAGATSFFVNWFGRRQTADSAGVRTGRATELGAHGSSFTGLAEQHVRAQGIVDAVRNFDSFVGRFGLKRRDGEMYTWREAERIRHDPALIAAHDSHGNPVPGYAELVPVRAVPARYSDATRRAVADLQDATRMPDLSGLMERRIAELTDAPLPRDAGARNVVLVPRAELNRFLEHQTKGSGAATRAGQVVTNAFRRAVLPFSVKWLTGNTLEAALRLAVVGAGPNSWRIGRRVMAGLEKLDAESAQALRARTLGGLLYGGGDRLIVHRTAESFRDSPALGSVAGGMAVVRRLPVVKQTLDGLGLYQRGVFRFNKWIEQNAQMAALGKEAKQVLHETTGSWLQSIRAAGPAYDDLLRGLRHTPNQVRFARMMDETLGKYSRFSPGMRRFIQGYAPFLPWYLNSARFVLWTLPAKHPIKVALLTRVEQTFDADFRAQHANLPPGDLKMASVMKDGGLVNFGRYMPFGAFSDLPRGLADPLLPQVSSPLQALGGRSFTGQDLRTADGDARGAEWFVAVNSMFEAVIPGMSIARRIREGGATPYDDSTVFSPKVKPGTRAKGGAARRILDPLRPIYVGGAAPASGGGGRGRVDAHGDGLDWSSASSAATAEGLDWRNARVVSP